MSDSHFLAVLNVGAAVDACKKKQSVDVQFITYGEAVDPSHTGIYGYTPHQHRIAELLASLVGSDACYLVRTIREAEQAHSGPISCS